MNLRLHTMNIRTARDQAGIVLPVVLIFLVIMTILGITAIRNVTLEERMAGNSAYQQLAFQAAEMALRDCERDILDKDPARIKFYKGQYIQTPGNMLSMGEVPAAGTYWNPASANNKWGAGFVWDGAAPVSATAFYTKAVPLPMSLYQNRADVANTFITARCMVEQLRPTPSRQQGVPPHCPFRVTARVDDARDANVSGIAVLLQSNLIAPYASKNVCSGS